MQEETESFFQDTFPRDTGLKRKTVLQTKEYVWRDRALLTHSFNWKHDVSDDNATQGTFKKEHLKSIKRILCLSRCKTIMAVPSREHLQEMHSYGPSIWEGDKYC